MYCRADDERKELSSAKFISAMDVDGCTNSSVMKKELVEFRSAELGWVDFAGCTQSDGIDIALVV